MTYLKNVKDSLHKASVETSRMMSAHLRSEARASEWPDHVVSHLSVAYNDGQFAVHAHDDHRAQVLDLEYGTPSKQPTAVIRRFSNRLSDIEKFLVLRTGHHMKGRS